MYEELYPLLLKCHGKKFLCRVTQPTGSERSIEGYIYVDDMKQIFAFQDYFHGGRPDSMAYDDRFHGYLHAWHIFSQGGTSHFWGGIQEFKITL